MRVRTEAKRSDILDIAAAVFLEQGFERASMSEIAARVGGSKATLYGYFGSKEELFVAVALAEAEKQLIPAFENLDEKSGDLRETLLRLGEKLLTFLLSPDSIAAHRMVLSEAGHSDIGHRFHDNGRRRAIRLLADFLQRVHHADNIRHCDFTVAATHLCGLIESELLWPCMFGVPRTTPSRREIRLAVERGVDAFLAAYAA